MAHFKVNQKAVVEFKNKNESGIKHDMSPLLTAILAAAAECTCVQQLI